VLIGGGMVTIGYSFLFGTRNVSAQSLITAALALTIALVMVSIMALEHPFSGFTYVEPYGLQQLEKAFRVGL
jgi:Na+/proline symporter